MNLDQLIIFQEMEEHSYNFDSEGSLILSESQINEIKKVVACLMLNRPLLNSHMGLKAPGSMGTLFMDQVNII
jgi:hypothetical protein